jgi:hypothetical protein
MSQRKKSADLLHQRKQRKRSFSEGTGSNSGQLCQLTKRLRHIYWSITVIFLKNFLGARKTEISLTLLESDSQRTVGIRQK